MPLLEPATCRSGRHSTTSTTVVLSVARCLFVIEKKNEILRGDAAVKILQQYYSSSCCFAILRDDRLDKPVYLEYMANDVGKTLHGLTRFRGNPSQQTFCCRAGKW